jgi:hypothetical protein
MGPVQSQTLCDKEYTSAVSGKCRPTCTRLYVHVLQILHKRKHGEKEEDWICTDRTRRVKLGKELGAGKLAWLLEGSPQWAQSVRFRWL